MSQTVTNIDYGSAALRDTEFFDDNVYFSGSQTFAEGTVFARSTAADATQGFLVPFVPGGADGTGTPVAVLTGPEVSGTDESKPVRVAVGTFKKERLILHADGDDSNIDAGVKDTLRGQAIIPVNVEQLQK